jgi:hypothetical protein
MKITKQLLKETIEEEVRSILEQEKKKRRKKPPPLIHPLPSAGRGTERNDRNIDRDPRWRGPRDPSEMGTNQDGRRNRADVNYDPASLIPQDAIADLEERLTGELNQRDREVFEEINRLKETIRILQETLQGLL